MAVNTSLEATKNALAEQHHQVHVLAVKCNKLTLDLAQANAIIKARTTTIDVKDQEGWDLQMQCHYKANELMEMTKGWAATKAKLKEVEGVLEEREVELQRVGGELERTEEALGDTEKELEDVEGELVRKEEELREKGYELERMRYEKEVWVRNYYLKEREALAWRANVLVMVRGLQAQIEELEREVRGGESEEGREG